jgi:hypothetical protein
MKKPKAAKARRAGAKSKAAVKKSTRKAASKKPGAKVAAKKRTKIAAKKQKSPARKSKAIAKKRPDPVELDSQDSFPASDPPSWVSVTGEGVPDRTGRKRRA